jgi:hypothetical protein
MTMATPNGQQTLVHTDTLKKAEQGIAAGYAAANENKAPEPDDFADVAPPPVEQPRRRGRSGKAGNGVLSVTGGPAANSSVTARAPALTEAEQDAALADIVRLSRRNNMTPADYVEFLRTMVSSWDLMVAGEPKPG